MKEDDSPTRNTKEHNNNKEKTQNASLLISRY
ncbi:hypothetical protein T4B_2695 [Trichinella pseudospiralis]|uniref:Uncharacterized protein n=1 Tax=Trichinella pseudospiralis TaxID=6337 RepID=A0A0V1GBV2_TRIPS|nr:hypothetical protein T4A_12861 [Trichinella pseudospiralis]KRY95663.1 hypothetical protein T4B_2695 [Trichinella pseudospiralis]KRZ00686.1 hypothetical protein T4C_10842 [Trichinella pseudospiralis]